MTVLHLPSADLLRVALAGGVVPDAVARRPVLAARDGRGVWLDPPADVRPQLLRLGATARHRADAPPLAVVPCWAVLVPLEPSPSLAAGPVMVPVSARRGHVRELKFSDDGRAWAVCGAGEPHDPAYTLHPPGMWVRVGWRHPLADLLSVPDGSHLVLDPDAEWAVVPAAGLATTSWFELPPRSVPRATAASLTLPVRLGHGPDRPAVLWVRPGRPADVVADLVRDAGPDPLAAFEVLAVAGTTLVRTVRPSGVPSGWGDGFVPAGGSAGWHVPRGRCVYPSRLPAIDPTGGAIGWLSEVGGTLTLNTARGVFRPLADWRAMAAPEAHRLGQRTPVNPFGTTIPALPLLSSAVERSIAQPPRINAPPTPTARLARVARRLRAAVPSVSPREPNLAITASRPLRDLEDRVLVELPARSPAGRAELWAELAAGYEDAGRPGDAAGCWLNAVWDHPSPPVEWAGRWRAAEVGTSAPGSPGRAARVAAAELAVRGPQTEILDAREGDVPVRAVWLARTALGRRTGGDPLGLARCRDRLLARLGAGGLALHLDAPGFVRRRVQTVETEAVRAWLTGVTDPIDDWLTRCGPASKLGWAGLDADRKSTRRYAGLIVAWGLATTGDASAAYRATDAAAGLLALKRPTGTDPAVHRLLAAGFVARIRSALSGHPAEPTGWAEGADRLAAVDRYAVDRLRAGCECLGGGSSPFDTPAGRLIAAADAARTRHDPVALRGLLADPDPAAAAYAAGPVFRAARQLGLVAEAAPLVATLTARQPPPGGRRDLGLAVGRYLVGDEAGGDRTLDAARHRLLVAGGDPRERGELATAYAAAVGHAAPRMIVGRLDELFRRLGPVSMRGACGRYFALTPLRLVDAAVRAAVGDDFAPSPAVRRFLADEELTTRRRIARDIKQVLDDGR